MTSRGKRWTRAGVAVAVLAGLVWLAWPSDPSEPANAGNGSGLQGHAGPQAGMGASAPLPGAWQLAADASAQADAAAQARAAERARAEQLAREVDQRWCSQGGPAEDPDNYRREAQARWRQWQADHVASDAAALQLLDAAELAPDKEAREAARLALRRRALASGDPTAQIRSLAYPCEAAQPGCAPLPAGRWAELEPQNVQAWMALLAATPSPTPELDRRVMEALKQTRYASLPADSLLRQLAGQAAAQHPGRRRAGDAWLADWTDETGSSRLMSWLPDLMRRCRAHSAPADCQAVLAALWEPLSRLRDRRTLVHLMSEQATRDAPLDAFWQDRHDLTVVQADYQSKRLLAGLLRFNQGGAKACQFWDLTHQLQQARWERGDEKALAEELVRAGEDPQAMWKRLQAARAEARKTRLPI